MEWYGMAGIHWYSRQMSSVSLDLDVLSWRPSSWRTRACLLQEPRLECQLLGSPAPSTHSHQQYQSDQLVGISTQSEHSFGQPISEHYQLLVVRLL